ncbi:unnamed protein product [Allacma fusca]|uniref:Uncharacterized protein n=1 Tax=Allacma fusca TaxID=39272 RepID=A0A8J2PMY4_9HEXA|nr:unnamed protein product [Allacma fusca]
MTRALFLISEKQSRGWERAWELQKWERHSTGRIASSVAQRVEFLLASELRPGCSYFVFKDGLKPMWEDEGNRRGGRWLMSFDRKNRSSVTALDDKWLELLLCLIGEAFDVDGEDICGAAVDVRLKFDKINVWTKNYDNKKRILRIGKIIKERLALNEIQLTYEKHSDTQSKARSHPPMYTI